MALATTVSLPVLRGPVPLAKALATIDVLSEGRLVAGFGPGSSERDYRILGIPFEERWARFDEALGVLRALLRGEPMPAEPRYYPVPPDVELAPGPHRPDGIPLWVGSWGSRAGLARVARAGDGWLASAYNTSPERFSTARTDLSQLLDQRGRKPDGFPNALATMWTWVSKDRAEGDRVLADVLAPVLGRDPDELGTQVCVGPVEHCAELLSRYAEAGCERVYLWPLGEEARQLELVAGGGGSAAPASGRPRRAASARPCRAARARHAAAGRRRRAAGRARVASVHRTPSPVSFVSSSTRAATLTASPISVNSSLPPPPTVPASTRPVLTPMPIRSSPPKASATLAVHVACGGQRAVGVVGVVLGHAEDAEQAVADELVRVPAVRLQHRHDDLEELVQARDRLARGDAVGRGGEAADVDEHHRHLDLLAGERIGVVEHASRDLGIRVAAERGVQRLALAQAADHPVEAARQVAELVGRDDRDAPAVVAGLDAARRGGQLLDRVKDRRGDRGDVHEPDRQRRRDRDHQRRDQAHARGRRSS